MSNIYLACLLFSSRSCIWGDQFAFFILFDHFVVDLKLINLQVFVIRVRDRSSRMLCMIHLIGSMLFFISNYLIRLFCELRSLLSELLLVNSGLIDLCLRFLLFGVEIGDFISEEFVVSLLSVGVLARNQKPNQTRPGEQKAGD